MGWFDEQIKDRKKRDEEDFLNAMDEIAAVITRRTQRKKCEDPDVDRQQNMKRVMNEILQYYHVKPREIPENIKELQDQMDYMCRPYGIMEGTEKHAFFSLIFREKEKSIRVFNNSGGFFTLIEL